MGQCKAEQALDESSSREDNFLTDDMERHFSIWMKPGCMAWENSANDAETMILKGKVDLGLVKGDQSLSVGREEESLFCPCHF